jgi:hypothetical protein
MQTLPEPKNDIPEQLKVDNWAFHVLARSDDPAIKCLNIRNLVANLRSTMMYADLMEFPLKLNGRMITMEQFLDYQILGANKAWNAYSQGKFGQAVEIAGAVLDSVLFIVYDIHYTKSQQNSFVPRSNKP